MPSRKSESSDALPESRRSSLRRLSSIASFQALNPFNRRRSNNTTTDSTAASSSSNLSLCSTSANAPQPPLTSATSISSFVRTQDELTELPLPPIPSHLPSRQSSYICLPDDPIGGMPRSRTFSNLPLPTRARKATPMTGSKSHSRLPSALLPSTRLPSPAASSRKHSISMLRTADTAHPPPTRNRMKRSDTEPLLPMNFEQANLGRSTAFKENISMSPVKPLPQMPNNRALYGSSFPSRAYASRHGWMDGSDDSRSLLRDGEGNSNYGQAPSGLPSAPRRRAATHVTEPSFSSPAYRNSRDRPPTPGKPQPVQRWNSQPVLTNVTNRRNSRHGEITERRLMSEVQIPPPPPPKTPLSSELLTGNLKGPATSTSHHLREVSDLSPSLAALGKIDPPASARPSGQISTAEPVPFWCGRFAALNDRYRNEELRSFLNNPKSESDKMHSPEANSRRMRRAMEHLHSLCATPEARESFVVFQLQYAAMTGNPDLGRPLQLNMPERRTIVLNGSSESVGNAVDLAPRAVGEARKASFMDRLLGREKKRRSLIA